MVILMFVLNLSDDPHLCCLRVAFIITPTLIRVTVHVYAYNRIKQGDLYYTPKHRGSPKKAMNSYEK